MEQEDFIDTDPTVIQEISDSEVQSEKSGRTWTRPERKDKVMGFWRTMSGKQGKFLTEAGTKKEKVAIGMAGIAKPTKDFRFSVKSLPGKIRVWNGAYEMKEPTGKTVISLGVAESVTLFESITLEKTWSKNGVSIDANCGLRYQQANEGAQRGKGKVDGAQENVPENVPTPQVTRAATPQKKVFNYDWVVTLKTSIWCWLIPPILLSIGRRYLNNKNNSTLRAGIQVPYSNNNRSCILEGTWKPEANFCSGRATWFWNQQSFVGAEVSNKRSCFVFVGTPFLTPNTPYFQSGAWKEFRNHMLLFTTLGVRNGNGQFGLHMTWK
eukprot:TRINITY_DN7293_c0_g1_i1.p1 TRINITY_DN7293_c0_g1~~TRINITY_DN7293_c0_g1_i1.p1  ORF type:complete len:324 (+),score=59.64 TRINITY_DN7293_c0_g1_i1:118-1089(+)